MSATDRKMKMAELRIENNNLRDDRNAHVRTNSELLKECYALRAENERLEQRIRELEEQQRWIPITEKLPEAGKRVQVRMKNNYIVIATRFHNGTWKSDNASDVTNSVTHWRPLPPPPEDK